VFGDKESVQDVGASNIYVQMYSIVCYEAVVVCIFDAGCALKLLSIPLPVGRYDIRSNKVNSGSSVQDRATAVDFPLARANSGRDFIVPMCRA